MFLKGILSICLFATALVEVNAIDTKDQLTAPGIPAPNATANDIKNGDCSKFTAEAFNKLASFKDPCSALTAACLAKFNVKDMTSECLNNVPTSEWKEFGTTTMEQISETSPASLGITPEQLKIMLTKLDMTKLSGNLAGFVVRSPDLLEVIFEKGDGKVLAAFVNADTLPSVPLSNFSRFTDKLVLNLKEDAFKNVTGTIIAIIPPEAFSGFYAKQWAQVNPPALQQLTRQQASELSAECWNESTPDQIKNFGLPVATFSAMNMSKKKDAQMQERRQFKEQHPCNALSKVQGKIPNKAKDFEERCKEVAAFKVNSAFGLKASAATAGLMLAAVAVPLLLL